MFNQPLSFDTSSVTDTSYMFQVRSAHAHRPPGLHSRTLTPCMMLVRCRRPMPSRLPAHTSLRIVSPAFDSADRFGVQPAAELRHVQRHNHALHVQRALRTCPIAPSLHSWAPLAVHSARALPPAHALPYPAHASLRIVRPAFDCAGRKLLVQCEQAADPLRVGGQLGLRLCWLRLELGSGKLPLAAAAHAATLAATEHRPVH